MREEEEEIRKLIAVSIFLCAVAVIVWIIFLRGGDSSTDVVGIKNSLPVVKPTPDSGPKICSQVLQECIPEIEFSIEDCDQKGAKLKALKEAELQLAEPLKSEVCKQAEEQLPNGCPVGCSLDFSSVLVVPGKVKIFASPIEQPGVVDPIDRSSPQTEKLQCAVKAKRGVTISGACLEDRI